MATSKQKICGRPKIRLQYTRTVKQTKGVTPRETTRYRLNLRVVAYIVATSLQPYTFLNYIYSIRLTLEYHLPDVTPSSLLLLQTRNQSRGGVKRLSKKMFFLNLFGFSMNKVVLRALCQYFCNKRRS